MKGIHEQLWDLRLVPCENGAKRNCRKLGLFTEEKAHLCCSRCSKEIALARTVKQ
jgi:hypothetical protein